MKKIYFDIYGLPLEISSDHPPLLETFQEDLKWFQVKNGNHKKNLIRLRLSWLSHSQEKEDSSPFSPYRELGTRRLNQKEMVTCYGTSSITVILHPKKRLIQAGILPSPSTLPDPAYHYCFTQPVNPWLKERGLFPIHAACVAEGGNGILIVGQPRAGKSVLSLSAVRRGFKFLGDEQPLLSIRHSKLRVHPFPRRVRLDRPVARIFPELESLLSSSSAPRIVFPIEKIWPGCIASDCELKVLIFPKFHTRGKLRLNRISPSAALARFLQDDYFIWYKNGPWNKISSRHLNLFQRLVEKVPSFSLDYGQGDILGIPSLFQRLLRG